MLKKLCTAALLLLTLPALAESDTELAKSYLLWIWNRELPDHLTTTDPAQRAELKKKTAQLIANYQQSGIDLGQARVVNTYSTDAIGTNNRTLLVVYEANGSNWDDVVLYLDKATNKIIDIGDVAGAFTMNKANYGLYYTNRTELPLLFDPKAITRLKVIEECRTLIRLANARRVDSFCTRVLYTGGDTLKRKNRAEACNPAMPKDKTYCAAVMADLTGYFTNPNQIETLYVKPEEKGVTIGLVCENTKNRKQLQYQVVGNKLLLSGVY